MCGVFGAYSQSGSAVLEDIYLGLCALQHRGQLSAGVAWIDGGSVHIKKGLGLVHEALSQSELAKIEAHTAIGHVRYATAGGTRPEDSQPLGANYAQGPIAIAHNGNLTNAVALSSYLANRGAIFQTSCDTETIIQLMAHQPGTVQLEALETALSKIKGAYSLAVLLNDCLIAARDPWGFRPLVLGRRDDTYFVASESCALDIIGAELVRDVEPGEILVIDRRGIISRKLPKEAQRHHHCSFEYVYFARPDSVIDGRSVYSARKRLGSCLAKSCGCPREAVVAGMPDSGTLAALGLAEEAGMDFEAGVVRNRYVGRTFIQPTQRVREAGVKIKLNPQPGIFDGKEAVIVDDSLVRGTTAGRIISMIRESGAERVHMRIASPPVRYPCYYGIDTPSSEELIAAQMDIPELCEKIGADSLRYISCEELCEAIGLPRGELCTACFDGNYLEEEDDQSLLEV
ncbi:amidophosphoribosyltransferase [Cloacibacillus porcorum]|mgnify:FL=1|uniref:amidophosphoribosyltransferase n=1 Tax=Cloacibacillus porcorum TaxID=1197717 RepID=UPI0014597867|nr:amidophosphoribosyltransferase [Cloacibacillus porcorum]MCC8185334.1 amidophosphoribosyltransferase [Cloacibacillus porcorum]MDY5391334.1 amidophosphoribosyltransferase [Cloacibacillus porcorum]NMF17062.1 amidophosphoribosyltransferase [Cloacibacillus porcorum]